MTTRKNKPKSAYLPAGSTGRTVITMRTMPDHPTVLRIAADADADPRSVAKEIATPGAVCGRVGQRIRAAIAAAGLSG
jgi:hypothetical protein